MISLSTLQKVRTKSFSVKMHSKPYDSAQDPRDSVHIRGFLIVYIQWQCSIPRRKKWAHMWRGGKLTCGSHVSEGLDRENKVWSHAKPKISIHVFSKRRHILSLTSPECFSCLTPAVLYLQQYSQKWEFCLQIDWPQDKTREDPSESAQVMTDQSHQWVLTDSIHIWLSVTEF